MVSRIGHTITGPHEYERDYKLRDVAHSARKPEGISPNPLPPPKEDGYPSGDFRMRFLVEETMNANGVYTLYYKGAGGIKTPGSPVSKIVQVSTADPNQKVFQITVDAKLGQSAQLTVDFVQTNGTVTDVHCMRPGYAPGDADGDDIASDAFLKLLDVADSGPLRNLSWSAINACAVMEWDGPTGFTPESALIWNNGKFGAPITAFLKICKQAGRPAWLCLPHLLSLDGHRKLAEYVRDHPTGEDHEVWLEFNEPWNTDPRFKQSAYFISKGVEAAKSNPDYSQTNKYEAGLQYYAWWFKQVVAVWRDVFGTRAYLLRPTLNTQAGNPSGTFKVISDFADRALGGLKSFITDASTAGYWGGNVAFWDQDGLTIDMAVNFLNANWDTWNNPNAQKWLGYVKTSGIKYASVYEGTLSTGEGQKNGDVKIAVNQRPEILELHAANLRGFFKAVTATGIKPGVYMNMLIANKHDAATTYGATTDGKDFTQPKFMAICEVAPEYPLPKPDPAEALNQRIASLELEIATKDEQIETMRTSIVELQKAVQAKQNTIVNYVSSLKSISDQMAALANWTPTP